MKTDMSEYEQKRQAVPCKSRHTGPRSGLGFSLLVLSILVSGHLGLAGQTPGSTPPESVSVTILTTNTADVAVPGMNQKGPTQGEWSFAAWVEVGEKAYLFDTGWSPRNVLENAATLGIDLSRAQDLILSHHHGDHTGGVDTLRRELRKRNPKALSRIHVADGFFLSRPGQGGSERNPMVAKRKTLEDSGSRFIIHTQPTGIAPGVWVTGPVPRHHDEKNYPQTPESVLRRNGRTEPDIVPESQALVIVTPDGPVMVSGCGHAGLVNGLEYIQAEISALPPQAAIGGFHLFAASDAVLDWTAARLSGLTLGHLVGSHCTGFDSVYRIREQAGLPAARALVGAIGTRFISGRGILPGNINR